MHADKKRHPLAVALLVAVALVLVPSAVITLGAFGVVLGVLFGWMAKGLGKT